MLIICPECKKKISNTCTYCIHCGYKLNQSKTKAGSKEQNKKGGSFLGTIFWIIVLVCIFRACSSTTETSTSNTKSNSVSSTATIGIKDTAFEEYFQKNPNIIKQCQTNYSNHEDTTICICKHFMIWFADGGPFETKQQTFAGKKLNTLYQKSAQEYPALAEHFYPRCHSFSVKRLSNI